MTNSTNGESWRRRTPRTVTTTNSTDGNGETEPNCFSLAVAHRENGAKSLLCSGAKHCEEERRERRRKEKKKKGVAERIKTEGNEKGKKEEREKSNCLSMKRE